MKRWAPILGSLAVVCFLSACGSTSSGVAGSSATSPGPFASQADQVVTDLAARNFTAVEGMFDPKVKAVLTPPLLQKTWTGYQQILGTYRSHGAPVFARKGQIDVERVPVTMAHKPGVVTISFNPNGTIAGLFFGVPPP